MKLLLFLRPKTSHFAENRRFILLGAKLNCKMDHVSRKVQLVSDKKKFDESLPKILDQIVNNSSKPIKDAIEHYRKSFLYNVLGGKMNRGMTVLTTWRFLLGDRTPSDEEYFSAIVLAWCVELLQASFLVADDVMDQSQTRRGKPCWYKQENVGLVAINDALMLECTVYKLVDINFHDKDCYANIISLFHQTTFETEFGQTLDMITKPGENFCNFTLDRYKAIVKWKTGFYSFYLPVALAMYMMGITKRAVHEKAKEILLEMGEFFQIQLCVRAMLRKSEQSEQQSKQIEAFIADQKSDDYLDCYGDPTVTGKIGTDIEDTKCSWLLVQALQRVDQEQLSILKENYGINDPNAVAKVKEVYAKLDLESVYRANEEISYANLMQRIEKAPSELPKEIFTELAAKIFKRDK